MIELGVGEVFVGYIPPIWLETLGVEVSPNRRYQLERQVSDISMLRRFGEICRAHDVGFVVAINDHTYCPDARALIPEIVQTGLSAGATGFIVANLQLLDDLSRELGRKVELISSCEAGVYNAETARQLVELGATRLIFAREMRLPEMGTIVEATRCDTVSYEAFIAREYCVYSSACCFATHGYGQTVHFCCAPSRRALLDTTTGSSSVLDDSEPGWCQSPRFLEAAHALNRCGFCALQTLRQFGVQYLKIPGRSDSALRALSWLRELIDSGDLSVEACRASIDSDEFCRNGDRCYYNVTSTLRSNRSSSSSSQPKHDENAFPSPRFPSEPRESLTFAVYLSVDGFLSDRVNRLFAAGSDGLLEADDFVAKWEKETANRALTALQGLDVDSVATPTQVVLGMEICGLRLPKPGPLRGQLEVLKRAGFSISLALPVAYQAFWDDICELVEHVVDLDVELIVNDWGLLRYASSHWDARLSTGRLLNRMKRDQFALDDNIRPVPISDDLDEKAALDRSSRLRDVHSSAYGYPYLSERFYCDLLHRFRVGNVAVDLLPTPLSADLSSEFEHTVYLPWTYVTSGRACRIASAVEGAVISYPTESCQRSCSRYVILPDYDFKAHRTVQRGSAVFIDCSSHVERFFDSASKGVTRIVWEPFVPY